MWSATFKRAAYLILLTGVLGASSIPGTEVRAEPDKNDSSPAVFVEPPVLNEPSGANTLEKSTGQKNIFYVLPLTLTPEATNTLDSTVLDDISAEDGLIFTIVSFATERSLPLLVDPYLLKSLAESPTEQHQNALSFILEASVPLFTAPYAGVPVDRILDLPDRDNFLFGNIPDVALQSSTAHQNIFDAIEPTIYLGQKTFNTEEFKTLGDAVPHIVAQKEEYNQDSSDPPGDVTTETSPSGEIAQSDEQQDESDIDDDAEDLTEDSIDLSQLYAKRLQIFLNDNQLRDQVEGSQLIRDDSYDIIVRSEKESALLERFIETGEPAVLEQLIVSVDASEKSSYTLIPNIRFSSGTEADEAFRETQLNRLLFAIESIESRENVSTQPFSQLPIRHLVTLDRAEESEVEEADSIFTVASGITTGDIEPEDLDNTKHINAIHQKVIIFLEALTLPEPARSEYRLLLAQVHGAITAPNTTTSDADHQQEAYEEAAQTVLDAISLDAGSDITQITSESQFWVSVSNNLVSESSLTVQVRANNNRLVIPAHVPVIVDGHSKQSVIIPVKALSNGQSHLTISLHDSHGKQIGKSQIITVNIHADIELIVLISFILLVTGFIGAGILRSIIKRKKQHTHLTTESESSAHE